MCSLDQLGDKYEDNVAMRHAVASMVTSCGVIRLFTRQNKHCARYNDVVDDVVDDDDDDDDR